MLPSESTPKCPMPSRLLFFVILGNISTPVNGFQSLLGSSKYISKKWRLASAWNEFSHWEHCPSPLTLIHQGPFLPFTHQSAVSTALTPQQICSSIWTISTQTVEHFPLMQSASPWFRALSLSSSNSAPQKQHLKSLLSFLFSLSESPNSGHSTSLQLDPPPLSYFLISKSPPMYLF